MFHNQLLLFEQFAFNFRVFLCIDLIIWFIRSLQFCLLSESIGILIFRVCHYIKHFNQNFRTQNSYDPTNGKMVENLNVFFLILDAFSLEI